ncbi:response regulator [Pseudomaricurvus alkylphenolicus]|uniref:response regulator n=1 Tax=Pseudomaricurvus alkylphenolicus TaxID=1306991 RepID=UPI0014218071|nr:response regulator [Pseudomaricurvus alkylphenolicus]NIB43558.1 response regulator [Pseudomaricurvus alkylphenolicus]
MTHILTVDDSQSIQTMINFVLLNQGYEVSTANSGEEALQLARDSKFDMVITDINMPDMDGYELTEKLRALENLQHVPVIALTTENDNTSKLKGKRAGLTGWLVKPLQPEKLCQIVKHFTR